MSYLSCPSCGEETHIFGQGGAEAEDRKLGINFLGKIPLEMDIRINADAGTPIVTSQPDSAHTEAYRAIARSLLGQLDDTPRNAPSITIN